MLFKCQIFPFQCNQLSSCTVISLHYWFSGHEKPEISRPTFSKYLTLPVFCWTMGYSVAKRELSSIDQYGTKNCTFTLAYKDPFLPESISFFSLLQLSLGGFDSTFWACPCTAKVYLFLRLCLFFLQKNWQTEHKNEIWNLSRNPETSELENAN